MLALTEAFPIVAFIMFNLMEPVGDMHQEQQMTF